MKYKREILNIIHHYGFNNQLRKLKEEQFELDEAIIRYIMAYQDNSDCMAFGETSRWSERRFKENIVDEFADVYFLLEQIRLYLGISYKDIKDRFKFKLERQQQRIKKELGDD